MAGPRWISEPEQRQAIALLEQQYRAGLLDDRQRRRYQAAVWTSNTSHQLYRRTRGRVGDPRTDHRPWREVVLLYLAVALAMGLATWLTAMAAADGLFSS